jgi:MFS family permease
MNVGAPTTRTAGIRAVAATPGALRLFAASLAGRLPLPFLSIGLLVHTHELTGSFADAGVVTGVYAVAVGLGGPPLGRLVDRRGQTTVLVASAALAALLLLVVAVLPAGAPLPVLLALAAAVGFVTPPLAACLRTLLPEIVADADLLHTAYAFDASANEATWVGGPPLGLAVGALWSPGAALAVGGGMLLLGTVAFAAQPASRRFCAGVGERTRGGSLQSARIRTLVFVLIAVGVLFGAAEVGVTAAAASGGSAAAAAPLLALWGGGGLLGGLVASRLGGGARGPRGLALALVAVTGGHLALTAVTGSLPLTAAVLLVAGVTIAPTYASIYAMVDEAAPAGTLTEAFAWLATATAIGNALGAAAAGVLADSAGPVAVFAFAGGAGGVAVLLTLLRSCTFSSFPLRTAESVTCTAAA